MLCPSGAPQRRAFGSFGLTQSCQHSSIRWTPDTTTEGNGGGFGWCCYDLMTWCFDDDCIWQIWHVWSMICLINDMFDQWYDVWSIRPCLFTLSYLDILHLYILDLDSGVYCRIWQIEIFGFVRPNWICIFSQGKTSLHLVSLGGAHGWTANLERQESLKDFRAVAFEAIHYHSVRIDNHDLIIYHVSYIVIIMRSIDCPLTTRLIIRRTGVGFQCVLLMTLALMIMNDPNIHHVQTTFTLSTCCSQPSPSGHPESRQSGWQCGHRRCQGLDGIVMCIVH